MSTCPLSAQLKGDQKKMLTELVKAETICRWFIENFGSSCGTACSLTITDMTLSTVENVAVCRTISTRQCKQDAQKRSTLLSTDLNMTDSHSVDSQLMTSGPTDASCSCCANFVKRIRDWRYTSRLDVRSKLMSRSGLPTNLLSEDKSSNTAASGTTAEVRAGIDMPLLSMP